MRVLASVPGEKIQHDWPDLVVEGHHARKLISDETLIETFDRLESYLESLGVGVDLVLRPEILGGERAGPYLRRRVPDLCAHIHIGFPTRFKYLKGCTNIFCATPMRETEVANAICEEFTFNPRRLGQISAVLNCFWLTRVGGVGGALAQPLWLPAEAVTAGGLATPGSRKPPKGIPAVPLFVDRADAQQAARAMMSKAVPLDAAFSGRSQRGLGESSFLAVLDVRDEWPTALAPVLSDLARLSSHGAKLRCLILLVGPASLDLPALERISRRLNSSLDLVGGRKGRFRCDSILLTAVDRGSAPRVLDLADSVFLVDPNWPESETNQLAVLAGLRPVFLGDVDPCLREAFHGSAVALAGKPAAGDTPSHFVKALFERPAAGAIRTLLESTPGKRLSPEQRDANARIARSALADSAKRLRRALGLRSPKRKQ
jgi:hypothetical protein